MSKKGFKYGKSAVGYFCKAGCIVAIFRLYDTSKDEELVRFFPQGCFLFDSITILLRHNTCSWSLFNIIDLSPKKFPTLWSI